MRARLLVVGEAPPRLAEDVLAALPRPFDGGEVCRSTVSLDACTDRQRAQVDAVRLLDLLPPASPGWVLAGVTGVDLFLHPLAYVFGLSALGERRGVVSWARLLTEPGDPPDLLLHRLATEVVHELGHGLGLVHCVVGECAMHRSLWPEQVDLKRPEYCPTCLEQLGMDERRET